MVAEIQRGQSLYPFLDKMFTFKVTGSRSKVISRSYHDGAQLGPLGNVPTKFELPPPYGCLDLAQTKLAAADRPPKRLLSQTTGVKTIPQHPLMAVV